MVGGAIRWCVALAPADGGRCAVHATRPDFIGDRARDAWRPKWPGQPRPADPINDCDWCDGTGKCGHCDGDGDHRCECGHEHDCELCSGSGTCSECHGKSAVATAVFRPPTPWDDEPPWWVREASS